MNNIKPDINKKYLVTGAAGFIGAFLTKSLLTQGCCVVGLDSINDYYDVNLKLARLKMLEHFNRFTFVKEDISDKYSLDKTFKEYVPDIVINLAAQAGVRYSTENPYSYVQSNIIGFFNILESCRQYPVEHFVYASSSSVYGSNKKVPFEESDLTDQPVSFYAATKKSNEVMAHAYSSLYRIPSTGLRFFTVYGPMGRPDMAYFGFSEKFFKGEPIKIYNNGDFKNDLYRDFTYIDDAVEGILGILNKPPAADDSVPHRIYNIGNNKPENLMYFIEKLEESLSKSLGRKVEFKKIYEPIKEGDVKATYASIDLLKKAAGFVPNTSVEEGLRKFADWYVEFYNMK
jgi:UDP-glucuronate 4-epimerase